MRNFAAGVIELSRRHGFRFVIGGQATLMKPTLTDEEVTRMWRIFCWKSQGKCIKWESFLEARRRVVDAQARCAAQHGILYIETETAVPKTTKYFVDDAHTLANGAERISDRFVEGLVSAGVFDEWLGARRRRSRATPPRFRLNLPAPGGPAPGAPRGDFQHQGGAASVAGRSSGPAAAADVRPGGAARGVVLDGERHLPLGPPHPARRAQRQPANVARRVVAAGPLIPNALTPRRQGNILRRKARAINGRRIPKSSRWRQGKSYQSSSPFSPAERVSSTRCFQYISRDAA